MKALATVIQVLCILVGFSISQGNAVRADEDDLLYRDLAPLRYDVKLQLHWERSVRRTEQQKDALTKQLRQHLQASVSGSWKFEIQQQGPLPQADLATLRNWDGPLSQQLGTKTFLITIESRNGETVLGVREGDHTTRQWGHVYHGTIQHDRYLATMLHRLIGQAFQPLYRITQIERTQIEMIALAGEWTLPESLFSCFRPHGLARPALIYRNRDNEIQEIQMLPLTYLSLESRERGRISARLISAFPAPLGSGRSKRVEIWGLGGNPAPQSTSVKLVLQTDPSQVLMGHRVVVQPKRYLKDEAAGEPVELLSDRLGIVQISAIDEQQLVWLYVWSGEALLARVPFVPGWSDRESLSLPDDAERLRVEGELERLRAELIADVSRRAISRIRVLQAASTKDEDQVSRRLAAHNDLPGRAFYLSKLSLIETIGVREAEAARNRAAVARIKRSCSEMKTVINRFLNPDRDVELREEAQSLLKLP
ncbi:MAG: hypothetical protein HUJ26_23190 [Planctomycetaceae bacterium]|nr:hypothetical protein [Planctomycetaceae bacterium]